MARKKRAESPDEADRRLVKELAGTAPDLLILAVVESFTDNQWAALLAYRVTESIRKAEGRQPRRRAGRR